jgi:hypothetical protein
MDTRKKNTKTHLPDWQIIRENLLMIKAFPKIRSTADEQTVLDKCKNAAASWQFICDKYGSKIAGSVLTKRAGKVTPLIGTDVTNNSTASVEIELATYAWWDKVKGVIQKTSSDGKTVTRFELLPRKVLNASGATEATTNGHNDSNSLRPGTRECHPNGSDQFVAGGKDEYELLSFTWDGTRSVWIGAYLVNRPQPSAADATVTEWSNQWLIKYGDVTHDKALSDFGFTPDVVFHAISWKVGYRAFLEADFKKQTQTVHKERDAEGNDIFVSGARGEVDKKTGLGHYAAQWNRDHKTIQPIWRVAEIPPKCRNFMDTNGRVLWASTNAEFESKTSRLANRWPYASYDDAAKMLRDEELEKVNDHVFKQHTTTVTFLPIIPIDKDDPCPAVIHDTNSELYKKTVAYRPQALDPKLTAATAAAGGTLPQQFAPLASSSSSSTYGYSYTPSFGGASSSTGGYSYSY